MRMAYDSENKLVNAENASVSTKYHCPHCKARVQLKRGKYRNWHFAHISTKENSRNGYNHQQHLQIQASVAQWFKRYNHEVVLEQQHQAERRRSDIAVNHNQMCIEVQCSPIGVNEIIERTQTYKALYQFVVWLLPWRAEQQCGQYVYQLLPYELLVLAVQSVLYFYDEKRQQLHVLYHIVRLSTKRILAERVSISWHRNPTDAFRITERDVANLNMLMRYQKYFLRSYQSWMLHVRKEYKYANMLYQLTRARINFDDIVTIEYTINLAQRGIFYWQLEVAWLFFIQGVQSCECICEYLVKEKTIISINDTIVQVVSAFVIYLEQK